MPRSATPKQTVQNRGEWRKTVLVSSKKSLHSSMRKPIPLFGHEHSKKKPKVRRKRHHWVTPLFKVAILWKHRCWVTPLCKSGISLILNNGVTQLRCFRGTLPFFFKVFFSKIFWKRNAKCKVLWKSHLYFWLMVLSNDDVFRELCPFFQSIFLQNILKKKRKVQSSVKKSSLLLINGVIQWRRFQGTLHFF